MKYIKLLMLIVAVSFFASCSDDDDYNTMPEVTVGFEHDKIVTSEAAGMTNIPVKINGDKRNGDIRFFINVEGVGDQPAVKDSMYYITGYEFNVPADSKADHVDIEIVFVNDRIPTEPRQFKITIMGLKGAAAGQYQSTTVVVNDNDGAEYSYESLFGKYQAEMEFKAEPVITYGHMGGATTPDDPAYNKRLKFSMKPTFSATGQLNMTIPMTYSYDAALNEGTIGIVMNKKVASMLAPNDGEQLEFILLNAKDGSEKSPVEAPFNIIKKQLTDKNGNPVLDHNNNPIQYNAPDVIKFITGENKAYLYQTMPNKYQGGFGIITFKQFTFAE